MNGHWRFFLNPGSRICIQRLLIMRGHRRQPSIDLLELMGVVKENGNDHSSIPPVVRNDCVHLKNIQTTVVLATLIHRLRSIPIMSESLTFHIIFVTQQTPLSYDYVLVAKTNDHQDRKQIEYIEELKKKKLKVTKIIDDDLVFYGIQAPKEIFERYRYLLKVSDACNWSSGQNIVPLSTRIRIVHFILNHTPIRSGESLRNLMKMKVFEAKFCLHEKKKQRELKENWARWTACLQGQPITAVRNYFGEKVALYYLWLGWYTFLLIPPALIGVIVFLYGLAFFNSSPLIKEVCEADTVSLLFDNGTVLFAMFMAVWATLFLEFWKRHRASYVCEWKVSDWCEEEEELILEIVNNANCEPKEYKHSYLRSTLVLICVTVMILVIIGLTHALVVFRVIAAVLLAEGSWEFLSTHSNSGAMMLGAVLHYLIITVMTRINRIVAMKLCEIEETRSFAATEKSFTVKMFTFQFFTYFSSLFYVAFFLGRWFKKRRTKKLQRKCAHCYLKDDSEFNHGAELCENCKLRDWLSNYRLNDVDSFSLFHEFLEMVIQFSFTTIFVAAFPLAPLLALINNIIEIRLDAIKMVTLERRLAIGVLAVIANGLVIGVSSDFIPRLVYRYRYGPCANGTEADIDCMSGYINNTLSVAHLDDLNLRNEFSASQMITTSGLNVTSCRYKDYRSNEDYNLTPQFWLILAVRFAFVILFEHVVVICKFIAAWFVPNAPLQVKNDRLFDKLNRLKEEL
ncbi:hypothetical protein F7725_022980, partial [Dissostichus mawsoni]